MTEMKSILQMTDEEMESIAGGTPEETQEILDYPVTMIRKDGIRLSTAAGR